MKYLFPVIPLILTVLSCGLMQDEYQKSAADAVAIKELCVTGSPDATQLRPLYTRNLAVFIAARDSAAAGRINSLLASGNAMAVRDSIPQLISKVLYKEIHSLLDLLKITRRMGYFRMEVDQLKALYGYFAPFVREQSRWIGRATSLEEECREALQVISRFPYSVRTERYARNLRGILLRAYVLAIMNTAEDAEAFCRSGNGEQAAAQSRLAGLLYDHIAWQAPDSLRMSAAGAVRYSCATLDRTEIHRLLRRTFPGSLEKVPVSYIHP